MMALVSWTFGICGFIFSNTFGNILVIISSLFYCYHPPPLRITITCTLYYLVLKLFRRQQRLHLLLWKAFHFRYCTFQLYKFYLVLFNSFHLSLRYVHIFLQFLEYIYNNYFKVSICYFLLSMISEFLLFLRNNWHNIMLVLGIYLIFVLWQNGTLIIKSS